MRRSSRRRLPRVALIQAPAFDHSVPCNSLALLTAHLKGIGAEPLVRDVSKEVHDGLERALGRELDDIVPFRAAVEENQQAVSKIVDRELGEIMAWEPDVVGLSVLANTEEWSLKMAARVKELSPRCLTMAGGAQCLRETMAGEIMRHGQIDAVALGEADVSLLDFVRAYEPGSLRAPRTPGFLVRGGDGAVVDTGWQEEFPDLDALPFMDFSPFDMDRYSPAVYITSSRGCVRKCSFCTHIVHNKTFRTMSPARVVAEIRHHLRLFPKHCIVGFFDSLVNGDVKRLAEISRLLVELRADRLVTHRGVDLGWDGQAILHPTMTPSLLRLMRQGGCRSLRYGLESGSQRVVDLMNKNFKVAHAQQVVRDTHRAGIDARVNIMVGFPGETEDDFQQTLDFIERNAPYLAGVVVSSCEIQRGAFFDVNAESFGVRLPILDRIRWETVDGSSTFDIREERVRRVLALADDLGLTRKDRMLDRIGHFFAV